MDFIKSCNTNILSTDALPPLHCIILHPVPNSNPESALRQSLARLRSNNALSSSLDNQLYVFGQDTIDHEALLREVGGELMLEEQVVGQEGTSPEKHNTIVTAWGDAIDGAITFKLARDGAPLQKLGKWSWIHASDADEHTSALFRLHMTQVPPLALSFAVVSKTVSLVRASDCDAEAGRDVILSPSGTKGRLNGPRQRMHDLESDDSTWEQAVIAALDLEGITLLLSTQWLAVEIKLASGEAESILWPQELCFAYSIDQDQGNRLRASSFADNRFSDALSFAESWRLGSAEREQSIQADLAARKQNEVKPVSQVQEPALDADLVTSPPFVTRPELTAGHIVYPTPPDGMGGLALTQPAAAAAADHSLPDNSVNTQPITFPSDTFSIPALDDDSMALEPLARETSLLSNVDTHFQRSMTDELFGDAGAEVERDEVGDDDFDFFDDGDEPDNISMAKQPTSGDNVAEDIVNAVNQDSTNVLESDTTDVSHEPLTSELVASPEAMDISMISNSPAAQIVDAVMAPPLMLTTQSKSAVDRPKALSPFDIRERLLPPPVPASISQQSANAKAFRRNSTFDPVQFNHELSIGRRLSVAAAPVRLPSSLLQNPSFVKEHENDDSDDSEDSSVMAQSSLRPPILPWQSLKRKRVNSHDEYPVSWAVQSANNSTQRTHVASEAALKLLVYGGSSLFTEDFNQDHIHFENQPIQSVESLTSSNPRDLIMIAQLIAEQGASCMQSLAADFAALETNRDIAVKNLESLFSSTLTTILPSLHDKDISTLAVQRDTTQRNVPGKAPARPPPRLDLLNGPDIFQIQAPYLRFRRADSVVEMLPPAVQFWEALSLAPAYGSKNVRTCFVAPRDGTLRERLVGFRNELRSAYESCRLGIFDAAISESSGESNDNMVFGPVILGAEEDGIVDAFNAYNESCITIAKRLAERASADPSTSFVLFLLDPFGTAVFRSYLCACFWSLYRTYLDHTKKAQLKNVSDLTFHILPLSLVSAPETFSVLTNDHLGLLAREIYDRCPPADDAKHISKSFIPASPSISLAEALPKRIGFQLTSNPPTDLLREVSELHVAYARSKDGLWVTVAWTDNTGDSQQSAAFCLRGTSLAAVFAEIWTNTTHILRDREGTWRVTIATADVLLPGEAQCWHELASAYRPYRGSICVLLLHLSSQPLLSLRPSKTADGSGTALASVLTPVSTPQASTLTFSPEAGTHTAPPTPAPEIVAEGDGEAHLVDLPDETWGIMLDKKYFASEDGVEPLACAALVKHGDRRDVQTGLPILGINVTWMLRLKTGEADAMEASSRPTELMLKELMLSFRHLALLAKLRGLQREDEKTLPLNLLLARRGAEALYGVLDAQS